MDREKPDLVSGSVDLLEQAAGRIKVHLDRHGTAELAELLEAVVREHPSMALRINLAGAIRAAMMQGHEAAAEALDGFLTGLMRSRLLAAGALAALVHENRWSRVATYSRSGQVRECLASARQAGLREVLLSEGRPAGEGLLMAGELRGEGLGVTLTTDSALPALLPATEALVVGTDADFGTAFVNKIGTAALLREARAAGVPTVVVTVLEKRLDGDGARLWENRTLDRPARMAKLPRGVSWTGELFEPVPWELVTHAVGR